MTVRQRPNATCLDSEQSPLTHPDPDRSSNLASSKPNLPPLPWYRYPLNVFIARTIRFLGLFGFWHHARKFDYEPKSIAPSRTKKIKARDGYEVLLTIYDPAPSANGTPVCVVNYHGGGFTIGSSTDDSRWANTCVRAGYTFISVEYRMAPEHPYPVPVEDCVDAAKYVLDHMDEFAPKQQQGGEKGKVVLSGFSAGGSLAVTTALSLLNPSLSSTSPPSPSTTDHTQSPSPYQNTLLGLIPFYPVLDWYTPRSAKLSPGVVALPKWLTRMFDTSYLPPSVPVSRQHPLISPLLAPVPMLRRLPDIHLCLCQFDSLGREGEVFGEKLGQADLKAEGSKRERDVYVRWVEEAKHGWDKPPHPLQKSVRVEYDAAIASIRRWESLD